MKNYFPYRITFSFILNAQDSYGGFSEGAGLWTVVYWMLLPTLPAKCVIKWYSPPT